MYNSIADFAKADEDALSFFRLIGKDISQPLRPYFGIEYLIYKRNRLRFNRKSLFSILVDSDVSILHVI